MKISALNLPTVKLYPAVRLYKILPTAVIVFLLLIGGVEKSWGQYTIAKWTFEGVTTTNTGTTPTFSVGSAAADGGVQIAGSAMTGLHTSASTVWSNPAGNGSVKSVSCNTWGTNDYFQFLVNTTNFNGLSITWDQTGSNTGPRDFKVQYSTNGSTFTDATGTNSTYQLAAESWSSASAPKGYIQVSTRTLDLSGIAALNNVATVYIRLVVTSTTAINGTTVAAAGTGRVDNFIVTGNYTGTVTNYYSAPSGNLESLSNWWTGTDGVSGANPPNFTTTGSVFNIQNRATATIGAAWNLGGITKVVVGDGTNPVNFTIPGGFALNGTIDAISNGTLTIANTTMPTFWTSMTTGGTVVFSALPGFYIPNSSTVIYGNLILDGTTLADATNSGRPTIYFKGNLSLLNSASMTIPGILLTPVGTANQTISGNSLAISLRNLEVNSPIAKTGLVTLAATTDITLSNNLSLNCTGSSNQFSDGGNTITLTGGGNINLDGDAAGYNLTGTISTTHASGTTNFRNNSTGTGIIVATLKNVNHTGAGNIAFQSTGATSANNVNIGGNFTVGSSAGTVTFGTLATTPTFKFGGNYTYSKTTAPAKQAGITFEFNGTSAQTLTSSVTGGEAFENVINSNTNTSTGLTIAGNISVNTSQTFTNIGLLSVGTQTISGAGAFTMSANSSLITSSTSGVDGNITVTGTKTFSNNGCSYTFNGATTTSFPAAGTLGTIANITAGASISLNRAISVTNTVMFGNVNSRTITTGSNLTLVSNAAGTARIADITNGGVNTGNSITGDATMERWIKLRAGGTGRAYRLLAPTVNTTGSIRDNWMEGGLNIVAGTNVNPVLNYGTQITGAGGHNSPGFFDETTSNAASLYSTTNAATPTYTAITSTSGTLNALTGYFLYVRGDRSMNMTLPLAPGMPTSPTTLRTTGTLLTGNQSFTGTLATGDGIMNLVTNPYASPISWNSIYTDAVTPNTNLKNYYTLWDPNVGTRGGFVTVTDGGAISILNGQTGPSLANINIQPGQAFFVTSNGAAAPTLTIRESYKSTTNNNQVFLVPPESFSVNLFFTEPNNYRRVADGVSVQYDNTYTPGLDGNDALEINNWDENIAIAREGKHLAIEGRPVIVTRDTLPLFMNNMKQQAYEFEFTPTQFTNIGLKAELIDNFLNTRTLLSVVNAVTVNFTVTADPASSATNRFMVVFGPFGPLAIDVLTIRAQAKNNGVQVDWTAKTELDMDRYELERSFNGTNFSRINTTTAIGTSTVAVNYGWLDANPQTGANFYRIKAIDKSGQVKYTNVVSVNFGKANPAITVNPNPVSGNHFNLQLTDIEKGIYSLAIFNNLGQLVYRTTINHAGGSTGIPVSPDNALAKGVYELVLTGENIRITNRITKN
jgi:hypothetical protein